MRRLRLLVVSLFAASMLLGPAAQQASAHHAAGIDNLVGVVVGHTTAGVGPGLSPTERTSGAGQFDDTLINLAVTCGDEVVVGSVDLGAGVINFTSDDDVSDGYGDISAATLTGTGTEVSATDGVDSASIQVDISGYFHRVLNLVRVDLDAEVTISRPGPTVACHGRLDVDVELLIVGPGTDGDPTSGFDLVGVASSESDDSVPEPCHTIPPQTIPETGNELCKAHTD